MWEQILPGLRIKLFMTVLLGVIYPLAMTGISHGIFSGKANGSLIKTSDKVVGSGIIGQSFTRPEYFHPRPSSAGSGYDPTSSSGSNLGPTSAKFLHGTTKIDDKKNEVVDFDGIELRLVDYCIENDIPYESSASLDQFRDASGTLDRVKLIKAFNNDKAPLTFTAKAAIPADAVTGSASGLDPHISPANAGIQATRVARARGVPTDQIRSLVAQCTEQPTLGFLGEPRVNVVKLNLALDSNIPRK